MPNTPIYGFTYPCETDAIDPAAFATLATQIDAKLLELQAEVDQAVGRYSSIQSMVPNQAAIAASVDTALTNAGSTYTIPVNGIYIADASFTLSATTITSMRLMVRLNAVEKYGRTYPGPTSPATLGPGDVPGVPLICAAGDTISCSMLFTGTGTGTASLRLNIRMIVALP